VTDEQAAALTRSAEFLAVKPLPQTFQATPTKSRRRKTW
jgi:hypothetical protein